MTANREEVEKPAAGSEVPKLFDTKKPARLPLIRTGAICAPPPPPPPEFLHLPLPVRWGRPDGWVCRRCTEWWEWHPYRPPTEQELDMPCVECRKTMEPEERAVEVNRHLLARLSTGPGFLALPVPSVVMGQLSREDSSATESTSGIACSVEETGRRLGCKRTMVFRLLREGRLVAAPRLGRKRMVLAESVDALLAAGGVDALASQPRKRAAASRGPRTGKGKVLAAEIANLPVE